MTKITPHIGIKGIFTLTAPWVVNPGEQYEITAIRTLSELARTGVDPKKSLYGAMGLTDGKGTFVWTEEEKANPNIITLTGTNGNVITVPDTYITSYPDTSMVIYQRVVIAIDTGMYPSDEDLTTLAKDLADLCRYRTNIEATYTVHRVPLPNQPTTAQHLIYDRVRKYERPVNITNAEEILNLRAENTKQKETIDALITKLEQLGVIP